MYRHICRQWRPKRHQSQVLHNPVFSGNIFSRHNQKENVLELPEHAFPNPLYGYTKAQLLELNIKEIKHLLQIPPKSVSETDQFHQHIIEIFHENIIKDTRLAVFYLDLIADPLVRETVFAYLRQFYKEDILRLSVLAFIENPESVECRKAVSANLRQILKNPGENPEIAANMALNYLSKLAVTGSVNAKSIFISEQNSKFLLENVPKAQLRQLFAAMVQTNIKFDSAEHYASLKTQLLNGSRLDCFVARTGLYGAKWHNTEDVTFTETQKQKMVVFYSISELAAFTQNSIRQKDVSMANFYLDLLVSKFEKLGDPAHLQLILSVMLSHSMAFKGPQECLKFLRYIMQSELKVVPNTLLRILTALRLDSFHDEALLMVNYLHTENLSPEERVNLVAEIMKVITGKFAQHPKIAVGYFASLFNDENDCALHTLKDLLLLDLIYGRGAVDSSFSVVQKAEIHEDLKNSRMTHANLRDIYSVAFQNLSENQRSSPGLIRKLYDEYKKKIKEAHDSGHVQSVFSEANIDEGVVALFLDHLLRENPESRDDMDLVRDGLKFEASKQIFTDFFENRSVKNPSKATYMLGLMISSSLLKHRDLEFAISVFKRGRQWAMPITFNQVYPIIMHHYSKNELDKAQQWFMLLMQSGAKAKSVAAEKLFRIAKAHNWPHTGTHYRNSARVKSRMARQEMSKLNSDAVSVPGLDSIAGSKSSSRADTNLGEELEQILHELAVSTRSSKNNE